MNDPSPSTPVFLLGLHRGGTTFVQRVLNCHPDVTIWGENGGFLTGLQRSYNGERHLFERAPFAEFSAFVDRVVSWASPVDRHDFGRAVAWLVESMYATAPFWGFKEIRHGNLEDLTFLKVLFPAARLVLLRRDPRDVLRSTIHARWSDLPDVGVRSWVEEFVESTTATAAAFDAAQDLWPDSAFVIDYHALQDVPTALALFDRIGIGSASVDPSMVAAVLVARVNSSFVDVGRPVDPEAERTVLAMYDDLVARVVSMTGGAVPLRFDKNFSVPAWVTMIQVLPMPGLEPFYERVGFVVVAGATVMDLPPQP